MTKFNCIFFILWTVLCPPMCFSMQSVEDLFQNKVEWLNGSIKATCYEAEAIAGVDGNFWPSLNVYSTIGQTFRCAGPRLVAIQTGNDNYSGYKGFSYDNTVENVLITLRKGSPTGKIVAKKVFTREQISSDLPLIVDQPSDMSILWYLEISGTKNGSSNETSNTLNATLNDTYPNGQIYLNGYPAAGDLHLRIHRSFKISKQNLPKVCLWDSYPEQRIWIEPEKTINMMLRGLERDTIELSGARNEWVSTQISITPEPSFILKKLELNISPLVNSAKNEINAENIRIEWLRYTKENYKDGNDDRLYPDPLAPIAKINFDANEQNNQLNTTFWVSVYIPENTPAGDYKTTVQLRVNDSTLLTKQLNLRVFDFNLSIKTHTRSGLFRTGTGSLENLYKRTLDLADFRLAIGSPFYLDDHSILKGMNYSNKAYDIIFGAQMQSSLIEIGKLLNERGLEVTAVVPWSDTNRLFDNIKDAEQRFREFWKIYYPILKAHGWIDQAYTRMKDEFKNDAAYKAIPIAKLSRECAPGIKIMVTAMNEPDPANLSKAIGVADIWCPSSRYLARALDFYHQRQSHGEQVWPYIHDFLFHSSDVAGGRMFFWMLQKYNLDGVCYFSLGPRGNFIHTQYGITRDSNDVRPGDGSLYYPGTADLNTNGLWRSARLHRIRDGIEDREYFWLMNNLAQMASAKGKLTTSISERINIANQKPEEISFGVGNFSNDFEKIELTRLEIADIITKLKELLK